MTQAVDQPGAYTQHHGGAPRGVRNAVAWSYVMSWVQQFASILIFLILARLLAREQFGLLAIAMVLIGFLQVFVEQGMTAALVQRKNLERGHLDSAFWIVTTASLALGALAFALAGWWAQKNNEPDLAPIIRVLAVMPVVVGLTIVQQAVLQRAMEFRALAIRVSVSVICGGAVGLGMAVGGMGVWALVGQMLAGAVAGVVVLWASSSWRPGLRVSWLHTKQLLSYSGRVMLEVLGFFLGTRAATLVLGLYFGAAPAGVYFLAARIMDLATECLAKPLSKVALPRFAQIQDDPERLRTVVVSFMHLSASVVFPPLAVLVVASDLIMTVLGAQWAPAGDALKVLCIVAAAGAVTRFTGPLMQALGRPEIQAGLIWVFGLCNAAGFVAAAHLIHHQSIAHTVLAMASVHAFVNLVIMTPICLVLTARFTGIRIKEVASAIAPASAAAVMAGVAGVAVRLAAYNLALHPVLALGLLLGLGGVVGAGSLVLLDHRFRALLRLTLQRARLMLERRTR